ncbi:response regulator [Mucilaginibacter sp. BJC16-A38]|uniref:hybrid sensor histidine kinase/response regulator transcription factor n=1 Tax=Mucilaginibacter phenanthrenivorans TaxID=1234842 RepID=UPI002157FA91|nr:hybrid sensor histidine kinase/response regulator transcription factor [Mucilaginibacter phenanthrenivorans]MCR8558345.1 response regulator [Mucilaginibacter phenanthrenivorans]
MRIKFYILIVAMLFACARAFAQASQYQFSQLDISNGLSHNQVNCIYNDSKGFMWFGTMSGLSRYDGYSFKVFKHDAGNKNSLVDDFIQSIYEGPDQNLWLATRGGFCIYSPKTEQFSIGISPWLKALKLPANANIVKITRDSHGDFWFVLANSGVYRYSAANKQTYHYSNNADSFRLLYSNNVADIAGDTRGNMWFVYGDGMIEKLDGKLNKITYRSDILSKASNGKTRSYSITADRDNDLWFYTSNVNAGVYYFSPATNVFRYIDKRSGTAGLNSSIVNNIVQADDGLIWIATDHGGINLLDKKNFKITYLLNRPDDAKSLRQNTVVLYKDNSGIMWAGTFKEGISYYHKSIIKFPLYRHYASDPNSLSFEDVDKFVEDKQGNLWIGTNGGGLIYFNRKTGKYTQYKYNSQDSNSLGNDIIVSLCIDHEQKLWIGTYFGGLDCFDGKTFTHYRHDDKVATSIADDRVWSIIEDSAHRLWIGTFAGGLEIFDRSKKIFYHPFKPTEIRCPYISAIFEDKDGNIWVGGYYGIDVIMKKTNQAVHYNRDINDSNSLIGNNENSITQDSRGLIWIGAREGLSIFNPKTGKFTRFVKGNGLPDNLILNILEDNKGMMWLSTSDGLSRIELTATGKGYNFQFKNFDETDGLQGREFNVNAALKTQKGELIFGGGHGFNIFDPLSIQPNSNKLKLIFTDFQLFDKSVTATEAINGHVILSEAISSTRSITLNHNENVFTIGFAALNFFNPNKVKYQYMMEGFDKGWLTAGNASRKATYTNLDGGDYVFKVRAANSDGVWDPDYITLKVKILPPFWKSPLAYISYVVLIIGILLLIRRRGIKKIRQQFVAEQEKQEAKLIIEQERQEVKRMHELDQMKIKFLTNVSHEFRTPLSLIMAPVDKMLNCTDDADQKEQLGMVRKNARRLLNLVNQLLDFRKMEVQELKLQTRPGDIVKFIKDITLGFTDIADEKSIGFVFDTDVETLMASFDHDKIERILFNLLSNAFKFTPKGGHISVLLNVIQDESTEECQLLEIKVIDTGIGIPQEKHDKIFERFFQHDVPGSLLNQGSGIGLSITSEFVKMHGGKISVESEPDHGSCFIIQLPLLLQDNFSLTPTAINTNNDEEQDPLPTRENKNEPKYQMVDKKPVVLLVEDNDDFRFYLKDNLKNTFFIIEAANGKDGWQKALSQHPDIMVSDISMPEMDGIELCKKIKADKRTSHIPVILLTALTGEEEQLKGLEIGANDYMTKPFNFEILLSKIKNLLTLQDTFKRTYKKQMSVQLQEVPLQSEDERFLRNMVEYIEQNILNYNLSVEELSRQMNMSRVSLYKKVLMLTGQSPLEFIRSIRLKKAIQLLADSQMSISQISYEVGFNTPKYFTKLFKEEYNMLPSEYINATRKKKSPA